MVKKTEKKITMGEKVLAVVCVILVVVAGIAVYLFMAERAKDKTVKAGEGISQAVFVRVGAVVELTDVSEVESVEVKDGDGKLITTTQVNKDTKLIICKFDWTPGVKYRFDVNLKDGSQLSTPGYAPQKAQPYNLFKINYDGEYNRSDDTNHAGIAQGASIRTIVDISPDCKYIALAMHKGRIAVVDIETQKELWSKYIDKMKWRNAMISEDSKYLAVGGTHTDAPVIVYNLKTGEEIWRYNCLQDLGAYTDKVANARTTVTVMGTQYVWVASTFGWTDIVAPTRSFVTMPVNESMIPQFRSHIYCFEIATGKKVWDYPKAGGQDDEWGDGMINKNINGLAVNRDGKQYIVIHTQGREPSPAYNQDWISILDAVTGQFLWRYDVPILPLCLRSTIYSSAISPDGKIVVIGPEDGRVVTFDNDKCIAQGFGSPKWVLNVGEPVKINNVTVHMGGTNNVATDGTYIYACPGDMSDEFKPEHSVDTVKLFGEYATCVYNMDGELLWMSEGRIPAGGGNFENQYIEFRGGYVTFSLNTAPNVNRYNLDRKDLQAYAFQVPPEEGESVIKLMDINNGGTSDAGRMVWSIVTKAGIDTSATSEVSTDGTYVAFMTFPKDYSLTGKPETHNIHGYYELNVYI